LPNSWLRKKSDRSVFLWTLGQPLPILSAEELGRERWFVIRVVSLVVFALCAVSVAGAQDPAQDGPEAVTKVTLAGLQRPDGTPSNLEVTLPQANHKAWPVVLFVHGWSAQPSHYTGLVENLASRGFAVANFDQIDRYDLDLSHWERAGKTAIDGLFAAAANPNSPLFGLLDLSKLAVMGHSYGGSTTTCLAASDRRVKVAVALTPGCQEGEWRTLLLQRASQVRIPMLVVGAQFDPIVRASRFARPAFNTLNTPQRLYVEIARAEHLTVTDYDIGYWQFTPLRFPFWSRTRAPQEVRTVSRRYATAWLEHHLGVRADSQGLVDGTRAAQDAASGSLSRYGTPARKP